MASEDLTGDSYYTRTITIEYPKLGLKFNGPEITSVTENGWASKNHVEIDDEIVSLTTSAKSEHIFKELGHDERLDLIQNFNYRPLVIKFKRPVLKDSYYTCELRERKIGMTMKGKYVKTVDPQGWAGGEGVKVGDELAELGGKGYAGLSDKERMGIFAGPRPLTIKFVRRNENTRATLINENKTQALAAEDAKWADLKSQNNLGVSDPTLISLTEKPSDSLVNVEASKGLFKWFSCCQSSVDKTDEIRVR